jgi:membrane-associated phospholipid phosphatase
LKLQAHTPLQVYAGAVLGFFICFWAIYYFL